MSETKKRTCYPGYCSFCRKSYRDVGSLAEAPDYVYICYRCATLCKELIEAEYHRLGKELPNPPAPV